MTSARRRQTLVLSLAATTGLCPPVLAAEDGVTSNEIVLLRIIALQGPAGAKGREQEAALQTYFAALNASGGMHGRRIVLRTIDADLRTDEELRAVYEAYRPFAFFLFGGTVGSAVAMRFASSARVPFVAPNSGATMFHQPPSRYVFNVRSRYRDEVLAGVRHFSLVGQHRVALVRVDDAFGLDAAQGYREAVDVMGIRSVYEGKYAAARTDFESHARALVQAAPNAVLCIGASKHVAELIGHLRRTGLISTFMTLSNNSSAGFVTELGAHVRGVIVTQVMPSPQSHTTTLSRDLQRLMKGQVGAGISYAAMEAYASAKVLVEGLRRSGAHLSREAFVQAMESIHRLDLGGLEMSYSPISRTGSTYVDLSILTESGKYLCQRPGLASAGDPMSG